MFTYGDIVKPKGVVGAIYYIVTDVVGSTYEIMRIYPITPTSKMAVLAEEKLELVAKSSEDKGKLMLDYALRERITLGYKDEPDFMVVMNHNINQNKLKKALPTDQIRYDKLKTVNECLDAMNDLKHMHDVFGDEAYLQLRDVAKKRLEYFVD